MLQEDKQSFKPLSTFIRGLFLQQTGWLITNLGTHESLYEHESAFLHNEKMIHFHQHLVLADLRYTCEESKILYIQQTLDAPEGFSSLASLPTLELLLITQPVWLILITPFISCSLYQLPFHFEPTVHMFFYLHRGPILCRTWRCYHGESSQQQGHHPLPCWRYVMIHTRVSLGPTKKE